jgi:hypothetical protein
VRTTCVRRPLLFREQRSYVGLSPRRCEAKIPLADTSRMSTEGPSLIRPRRSPDTSTGRHRRAWRRSLRGGELGVFTVATVRDDAASDAPRVSSTHINRCLRAVCGPAEVGQHQARSPTGIAANVHSVPREAPPSYPMSLNPLRPIGVRIVRIRPRGRAAICKPTTTSCTWMNSPWCGSHMTVNFVGGGNTGGRLAGCEGLPQIV